jgi:hypothetical protein
MKYRVRNWERYQHYKDRNPPWIKLHIELLSSEDWVLWDDASRVLATAIMLLAPRSAGIIDGSKRGLAYIKRVAYLNTMPNLKPLLDSGFIVEFDDASNTLATCLQHACSESESEAEAEAEAEAAPPNRPPQGGAPEPPEFLQAWSEYPRRSGGNPRKPGLSAWKARVREGRTTPADALEAVRRYRTWCEATGKIGTETVMQFASFFGQQKEGYLQDWTQPAAESGSVNSEDAEVDRRHLADKKRAIRMMVLDGDVAAAMAEINHVKAAWKPALREYVLELQAVPDACSIGKGA